MKILNIDQLAQVKRQVFFKGINHDVKETSVQQFIDSLKAAEDLEEAAKDTGKPERLSAQVETSVKVIGESIPTMSLDELKKCPIEVLSTLLKFIRGEMDPDEATAPAVEGTVEKKPD
jgi:hypothetical protein